MFYGTMVARSNHCSSPLGRHNARPAILLRKNRVKLIRCFMVQWLLEATIVVPTLPPKAGRQFAGRRTPVETHQMFYGTMVVENNHCSSPLGRPMSGWPFCFAKTEGNYRISYSITIAESTAFVSSKCCELWFPPCRQKQGGSWPDGEHRWKPFHIHSTILFREEM